MSRTRNTANRARSGRTSGGFLLGLAVGCGLAVLFISLRWNTSNSDGSKDEAVSAAQASADARSRSVQAAKEELLRQLEQERVAIDSFRKAQNEYRTQHRSALEIQRVREADARQSEILAAGTRLQLASGALYRWIGTYPEPPSIAKAMNGGVSSDEVSDLLTDWYSGFQDRIEALVAAECELAAARGGGGQQGVSTPSLLKMARERGELREPTSTRLARHFVLDQEDAKWLAAQLKQQWREVDEMFDDGLVRVQEAQEAGLTEVERDQLICSGRCEMVRTIDGDTIEIRVRDSIRDVEFTDRVRLLNVNTPEAGDFGSYEAAEFLERECRGELSLEFEYAGRITRDKYGRVLAFVFSGKKWLNAMLIEQGHSKFYTEYGEGRYAQYLRFLESRAKPMGSSQPE